jgi:hypothetical protein
MDFELRITDKEIPAWGGMALMKRMLDHMGFGAALASAGLPPPGSNRGYAPEQLITQFMLSVWCGANRFEHGEVTRHDLVLKRIFGFTRMANFKAVMRLFRRFTQSTNEGVMDSLYRWMFDQISINGITLDVDSTVMTRYGCQEGHGWWGLLDDEGKPVAGIELTRFSYQSNSWSKPRWVTGIRQHIERRDSPKGKTLSLFADDPVIGK